MLRVSWLEVIVPYILYKLLISLLYVLAGLSDIWHLAGITCEFIDFVLVNVLGITGWFRFCELLYGVGTLNGNSYVGMFEEVCDLSYFRAMVCECCSFFVFIFVFFVVLILVGILCFMWYGRTLIQLIAQNNNFPENPLQDLKLQIQHKKNPTGKASTMRKPYSWIFEFFIYFTHDAL